MRRVGSTPYYYYIIDLYCKMRLKPRRQILIVQKLLWKLMVWGGGVEGAAYFRTDWPVNMGCKLTLFLWYYKRLCEIITTNFVISQYYHQTAV